MRFRFGGSIAVLVEPEQPAGPFDPANQAHREGRRLLSAHHRLQVELIAVQTILGKPKTFATKTITFRTA